ncbi:hypothetical protein [Burkholderia sp. 3C]
MNLNKIAFLFFLASICNASFAGEAMLFDEPNFVAYQDGGKVYGFYDARDPRFSCSFFFYEDGSSGLNEIDGYSNTGLSTFVPGGKIFYYKGRNKGFDIAASLYRDEDEWMVRTKSGQAGCENAAGSFLATPNNSIGFSYHVEKKISALGIRLVERKTILHDMRNGEFIPRKGYLTTRDSVVLIDSRLDYSLVRYVNPYDNSKNQGKVVTGWVKSGDLVNPFPR